VILREAPLKTKITRCKTRFPLSERIKCKKALWSAANADRTLSPIVSGELLRSLQKFVVFFYFSCQEAYK